MAASLGRAAAGNAGPGGPAAGRGGPGGGGLGPGRRRAWVPPAPRRRAAPLRAGAAGPGRLRERHTGHSDAAVRLQIKTRASDPGGRYINN